METTHTHTHTHTQTHTHVQLILHIKRNLMLCFPLHYTRKMLPLGVPSIRPLSKYYSREENPGTGVIRLQNGKVFGMVCAEAVTVNRSYAITNRGIYPTDSSVYEDDDVLVSGTKNGRPHLFLSRILHLMIKVLRNLPAHCYAFQMQMF